MFVNLPEDYDKIYLTLSRRGARVLALGWRDLGTLSHSAIRELKRENVEDELQFAGFVIISCPLKPDSKSVIRVSHFKFLIYIIHNHHFSTSDYFLLFFS